jgi:hypothetical protein
VGYQPHSVAWFVGYARIGIESHRFYFGIFRTERHIEHWHGHVNGKYCIWANCLLIISELQYRGERRPVAARADDSGDSDDPLLQRLECRHQHDQYHSYGHRTGFLVSVDQQVRLCRRTLAGMSSQVIVTWEQSRMGAVLRPTHRGTG